LRGDSVVRPPTEILISTSTPEGGDAPQRRAPALGAAKAEFWLRWGEPRDGLEVT